MPTTLNQVKPGDLITATDWNALVNTLNSVLVRIEALENVGSRLTITQVIPSGPIRVGEMLRVIGTNFQFAIGATRVFFRGAQTTTQVLTLAPTSTDKLLEFTVPNITEATEAGTAITLEVANQNESATWQLVVRPRQVPLQGIAVVTWQSVTPSTVVAGQAADFRYRIESRVNTQATWTLIPAVAVETNATAWNSQLRVLNDAGSEITSRQIVLDPLVPVFVVVRLAQVPAGTGGVQFGLSLDVSAQGVTGTSGVQSFTVGTPTPLPDPAIVSFAPMSNPTGGTLVGGDLTVPVGNTATFTLRAVFRTAASFTITRTLPSGATDWTVAADPLTGDTVTITQAEIDAGGGTATKFLEFRASPTANAQTRRLSIKLQRTGQNASAVDLNLVRG